VNVQEAIRVGLVVGRVAGEAWAIFAASILVHEIGHALAARLLRVPVSRVVVVVGVGPCLLHVRRLDVRLLPALGFVDVAGGMHGLDQRRRVLIAVAGPAASALLGIGLVGVLSMVCAGHAAAVARAAGAMNIGIAGFNLLPVPLLDGWHVAERYILRLVRVQPGDAQRLVTNRIGATLLLSLPLAAIIVGHMRH
jgi:membrane-associated protease RseP (regulator of RpoE activity)